MTTATSTARVLLIADDPSAGDPYRGALEVGGYDVKQAESFVDVHNSAMPDADVVVLCDLAVFAEAELRKPRQPREATSRDRDVRVGASARGRNG